MVASMHQRYDPFMSSSAQKKTPEFDAMSVDEQIDYVQSLWDRIAARPDGVSVTPAQRQELDRRLKAHRANPDAARPWEEVRAEIESEPE